MRGFTDTIEKKSCAAVTIGRPARAHLKVSKDGNRFIDTSLWRTPKTVPGWESTSLEALIAHFDRVRRRSGAPQAVIEALMYSLRERAPKRWKKQTPSGGFPRFPTLRSSKSVTGSKD